MYCLVSYGYRQTGIFNINCQVAPLFHLIIRQAHSDITKYLSSRQAQVDKEIQDLQKKHDNSKYRLYLLDNPNSEEEFRREMIRRKIEDERRQRLVKGKKASKEFKASSEVQSPTDIPIEEQVIAILEKEREDHKTTIDKSLKRIQVLQDKLNALIEMLPRFDEVPTVFDLVDLNGNRMRLGEHLDEQGTSLLQARGRYVLVSVQGEDDLKPYKFDGFCVRTPEEDENFVDDSVELKKPVKKKKKQ